MSSSFSTESDYDEDINYWQELDFISEKFRRLAQQEERYIFEREFELPNQVYKLATGLSAARNYVPAIRLLLVNTNPSSKTNHISFDINEWAEFISYLKQLMSYFDNVKHDDYTDIRFEIDHIKISSGMCLDMKTIKVDNNVHVFYLGELIVREIINLHEKLIDAHLFTLCKLDFVTYYNNFLESANDILCESNYTLNPEDVLLNLSSVNAEPSNFMQLYCIRECLFYNRDKVLNELDRKMYLQK